MRVRIEAPIPPVSPHGSSWHAVASFRPIESPLIDPMRTSIFRFLIFMVLMGRVAPVCANVSDDGEAAFFESQVLPIIEKRCFECHSHGKSIKAGLALDSRSGWEKGGDSGPAAIPGKPDESLLILAVEQADDSLKMPPKEKLTPVEIAVLRDWVRRGAYDPRKVAANGVWESVYRQRLDWWSLKPVVHFDVPRKVDDTWSRTDIDRFLFARMRSAGVSPAPEADRHVLARRLAFVLNGLPLEPTRVQRFVADRDPQAFEKLIEELLASPRFGERWARHWMDVVHYSDTHGYEWDVPAKNAWMYRDYLVRAFNCDLPVNRLIVEQIAGDLIEPRIDPQSGLNESIVGPMAMRLGERRHGDNAAVEGVTQEAMANIVDTVSKAFQATTVACTQCHDHKLDAVEQKDYYAWTGIFMSSRWGVRQADALDPNLATIRELDTLKSEIRAETAKEWERSKPEIATKLKAIAVVEKSGDMPETLAGFLSRPDTRPITALEFQAERNRRIAANEQLKLIADFSKGTIPEGWSVEGFGMKHGLARDGDFVVAEEGEQAIARILPAGRWSHLFSQRLGGVVRGPLIETGKNPTLSIGFSGSRKASQAFILDQCFHSERLAYPDIPRPGWLTLTAGNFDRLSGPADTMPRRVYLELATKAYNNYFPPRTGYGGVKPADEADPRSWFGVTRVYEHAPGANPRDTLGRFAVLFESETSAATKRTRDELAGTATDAILAAVRRWAEDRCDAEDALLLDEAIASGWLRNAFPASTPVGQFVARYREIETKIVPDRTIGTAEDRLEARDEPVGLRGSYTEFGEVVPRGNARYVRDLLDQPPGSASDSSSGRKELAFALVNPANPLTARVFVNRVWEWVFGEGLVRTPDDFGHVGERSSHPELLDHLAARFMAEGWSLKRLVREMARSAAFRQSNAIDTADFAIDPENRLLHHYPQRRLEAEALRDTLLYVSGRLDPALGGPPIDPFRSAEDAAKRLKSGPLDGNGRRSIYQKITLMEPPRFLAIFNQPLPKLTTGKRDRTTVPDQALALLNDPFVHAMAEHWARQVVVEPGDELAGRCSRMFERALGRPASERETDRLVALVRRTARLRNVDESGTMGSVEVWKDLAHAIFNLKEFAYVR